VNNAPDDSRLGGLTRHDAASADEQAQIGRVIESAFVGAVLAVTTVTIRLEKCVRLLCQFASFGRRLIGASKLGMAARATRETASERSNACMDSPRSVGGRPRMDGHEPGFLPAGNLYV